jgi:peroxiredoxin
MIIDKTTPSAIYMKNIPGIILLLTLCMHGFAQDNPYNFEVRNLKDTTVYLANYYGEKLYYADTARADANGSFSFKGIPEENQGKYAVVIPGPKFFEIIIADNEEITIKTDTADLVANVEVLKSENNKLMYKYLNYISERRKEREKILEELEGLEEDSKRKEALQDDYRKLNERVMAYQRKIGEDNPGLFAADEILMSVEPEVPEEFRDDKLEGYTYFKNHYWDFIDLKDDRIVRTPVFHNKLNTYLNKTLIQNPDSLILYLDQFISKMDRGSEVFKYVVHYTTYNFETSKIMGMDKVFVHMVDTYYKEGVAFWMDDDKLAAINEKADAKRNTLIGMVPPELILQDTSGTWISDIKDITADYTLLYFYDPDCGHCKKETPKLVEFYNNYDPSKMAVYAVSADPSEKWKKFIKKNEMNFFNVAIPQKAFEDAEYATNLIRTRKTNYQSLKYQETFDVFSTPKVILLDSSGKIIAKDIGVDQIQGFIDRFEGKETETSPDSN